MLRGFRSKDGEGSSASGGGGGGAGAGGSGGGGGGGGSGGQTPDDMAALQLSVSRNLSDKLYDKRKLGALEVEQLVRELRQAEDWVRISSMIDHLVTTFSDSALGNARKGGLIAMAAAAIGLGDDIDRFMDQLVLPVLHCFRDDDAKIRYFACESLYNLAKAARHRVLAYYNEIFDALCKLAADPEPNVKNGAQLLDRLIKDIVTDNPNTLAACVDKFIPLLAERVYVLWAPCRSFLVAWVAALDAVPEVHLLQYLPMFADGLFAMLRDPERDIRTEAHTCLSEFLREINDEFDEGLLIAFSTVPAQQQQLKQLTAGDSDDSDDADAAADKKEGDADAGGDGGDKAKSGSGAVAGAAPSLSSSPASVPTPAAFDLAAMVRILISHANTRDRERAHEFTALTALQWITAFLGIAVRFENRRALQERTAAPHTSIAAGTEGGSASSPAALLLPFAGELLDVILPSVAHRNRDIQEAAAAANAALGALVTGGGAGAAAAASSSGAAATSSDSAASSSSSSPSSSSSSPSASAQDDVASALLDVAVAHFSNHPGPGDRTGAGGGSGGGSGGSGVGGAGGVVGGGAAASAAELDAMDKGGSRSRSSAGGSSSGRDTAMLAALRWVLVIHAHRPRVVENAYETRLLPQLLGLLSGVPVATPPVASADGGESGEAASSDAAAAPAAAGAAAGGSSPPASDGAATTADPAVAGAAAAELAVRGATDSGPMLSESTVRLTLDVLATIAGHHEHHFSTMMHALVHLFRRHRSLLDRRGAVIITHLCDLLTPHRIFTSLAQIISSLVPVGGEGTGAAAAAGPKASSSRRSSSSSGSAPASASASTVEFATTLVRTLNLILLTAPEVYDLRRALGSIESFASLAARDVAAAERDKGDRAAAEAESARADAAARASLDLFTTLYRAWCHSAASTFSLCLLSRLQHHRAAAALVSLFGELEVTVPFLLECDKLVQLIESPVFVSVRLQLTDPASHPYLFKALYGLLALLPQSAAYHTLQTRLQAAAVAAPTLLTLKGTDPAAAFAYDEATAAVGGGAGGAAPAADAAKMGSKARARIKAAVARDEELLQDLLVHFRALQTLHDRMRQQQRVDHRRAMASRRL